MRAKSIRFLVLITAAHKRWNDRWSSLESKKCSPMPHVVFATNRADRRAMVQQFVNENSPTGVAKAYTDIMNRRSGLRFVRNSFIDRNVLARPGASYGGYMINGLRGTTMILDSFKVLVSHDGVYNLVRVPAPLRAWVSRTGIKGTPWTNPPCTRAGSKHCVGPSRHQCLSFTGLDYDVNWRRTTVVTALSVWGRI